MRRRCDCVRKRHVEGQMLADFAQGVEMTVMDTHFKKNEHLHKSGEWYMQLETYKDSKTVACKMNSKVKTKIRAGRTTDQIARLKLELRRGGE